MALSSRHFESDNITSDYHSTEPEVNILMVGLDCCGKDNLINSFVRNAECFSIESNPFACEYRCLFLFGEKKFRICIRNPTYINVMRPVYCKSVEDCYRRTNVVMYCYGIDTPESLMMLQKLLIPKVRILTRTLPSLLVGNRVDLRNDPDTIRRLAQRKMQPVTIDDGRRSREMFGINAFIECLDMNSKSVSNVFRTAMNCFLGYSIRLSHR
ncbi:ras-like GTP-binding protein Rho1 [Nephila pilipes]|uniref:Ras-like GTP-binding protein Rho1 n=1 Tax=Nephila pilipes TaxID=299642 RepID=A0A8X6PTD6_NEPPI|nr:ras-like GTP-binding protein Rho1 [Nephila pilipes]